MKYISIIFLCLLTALNAPAQNNQDSKLLTLDRIYASGEFRQDYQPPVKWIADGESYIIIERNNEGQNEMIKYSSSATDKSTFLSAAELTPANQDQPLQIEAFSMSNDESKVLIFTNSKRVWRSNTKGDYWVFDLTSKSFHRSERNSLLRP